MTTTLQTPNSLGETRTTIVSALPAPADPAPLGLAAFALTTFLLSAKNANWTHGTDAWLGYALAYGGACQLLAGMWEFRNRNVFGATAFSSYGGFWIGLGLYIELVVPADKPTGIQVTNDLGWILMAFAIFNFYMLLWSMWVNPAVFGVFFTLQVTEILLCVGNLSNTLGVIRAGGIAGVVTAAVAWYTSSAGVINGLNPGKRILPVGKPFMQPVMAA